MKIFLVEDEVVIRKAIKNSIDWEKEGYQFVGEASDGELAYPMILKEKPDILITDIKMPFMNGLELSRMIKQELPDIKILILSGYDDFEYAKEAIQIGVTDYLLKPISSEKLLQVLQKLNEQIKQEREERELLKSYQEETKEKGNIERQKFFNRIIRGEISFGSAIQVGKEYGIDLSAQCYNILLFKVFSAIGQEVSSEEIWSVCENIEHQVSNLDGVYSFRRGADGWAFLLSADNEEQMELRQKGLCILLKDRMSSEKRMEYFGGIGKSVERIRNLKQSYHMAEKNFAERFTRNMNQILSEDDLQVTYSDKLDVEDFGGIGKSREMIERFLNSGTKEEVSEFVAVYIKRHAKSGLQSTMMRQYIIMDIYIVVMSFCERMSLEDGRLKEELETLQGSIYKQNTQEEINQYMSYLLGVAIDIRDSVSGQRYSDVIAASKEIIAEEYMSDEISLNVVATKVGMSPSYFSSIFSKEVGKTFVEYLTETRMKKATELLMCSNLKTSEIGYEVGYKDPHYFSYIFKKTQGCSPKEYRSRRKE